MSQNQGGDRLAAGMIRFQFQPAGSKVTQEAWDAMFEDFDAEKFRNSHAYTPPDGDAGVKSPTTPGSLVRT
jgi:hypothetical protein